MNYATLKKELKRDEGMRLMPYRDTVGKLTIGVGRNLDDVGISESEADFLLMSDVGRAEGGLDGRIPWWRTLDETRQRVLVNMAYNMGIDGLMGFKNTLKAVQDGRWDAAAEGMLDSKWAQQVGARASRLADMMRTGS